MATPGCTALRPLRSVLCSWVCGTQLSILNALRYSWGRLKSDTDAWVKGAPCLPAGVCTVASLVNHCATSAACVKTPRCVTRSHARRREGRSSNNCQRRRRRGPAERQPCADTDGVWSEELTMLHAYPLQQVAKCFETPMNVRTFRACRRQLCSGHIASSRPHSG